MKILGFFLIALGVAAGFLILGNPSSQNDSIWPLAGISVTLIALGVFIARWRIKRAHVAPMNHLLRAVFNLLVSVPVAVFLVTIIPTFVSSFFLPPGEARWVMYGVALLVAPLFLWGWWIQTRMVLSRGYRKVEFGDPTMAARYQALPEIPETWNNREVKTKIRRKGTTQAKFRSFAGHFWYMSGYLIVVGLTKIPLIGLIFHAVKVGYERHVGEKLDALTDEVKRLEAPSLEELLEIDSRAPILLLRSFQDDGLAVESIEFEGKNTNKLTFEEILCRHAMEWGPVIAIGDPNEAMPQLGAARAYFTHDKWQDAALEMLRKSQVILIVMGLTPNVAWELERIFEKSHHSKTIVIFPPGDEFATASRFLMFKKTYEHAMGSDCYPFLKPGYLPLAVAFDTVGKPVCINGPLQVSMGYGDALHLASKVVLANREAC